MWDRLRVGGRSVAQARPIRLRFAGRTLAQNGSSTSAALQRLKQLQQDRLVDRLAQGRQRRCSSSLIPGRGRSRRSLRDLGALVSLMIGDDADGVVIKLYGAETNAAISIIEQPIEPGYLLPPHVHQNDVWLYVLEGEMHARVGDEVVQATPGCWILKPRRIPHTMWNAGLKPARIIELYTPGGFELFFKDFGERLRQGPIGRRTESPGRAARHSFLRRLDS